MKTSVSPALPGPDKPSRLLSLDVFRGITVAGMILVNNPGSRPDAYAPLRHSEWHGLTPTDVVFPFFLFIVGVSLNFSWTRPLAAGVPFREMGFRLLRRTCLLFTVGIILANFPSYNWETLRLTGVLQRIALCYCGASLIRIAFSDDKGVLSPRPVLQAGFVVLIGYYIVMRFAPGSHHGGQGAWDSMSGNLAGRVDRDWIGVAHLRKGTGVYDSMGLLPTVTAGVTTLAGMVCGWWLSRRVEPFKKLALLLLAGCAGCLAGYLSQGLFAFNKDLWSSSYVLFTAGLACIGLGVCYWHVEVRGSSRGVGPFLVFGSNALAAYCASELVAEILSTTGFRQRAYGMLADSLGAANGSLAYASMYLLLWLAPLGVLYRRKIFLKL